MKAHKPAITRLFILATLLAVLVTLAGLADLRARADGGAFPTPTPTVTFTLTPIPTMPVFSTNTPTPTLSLFISATPYPGAPPVVQQQLPEPTAAETEQQPASPLALIRRLCLPISLGLVLVALVAGVIVFLRQRK